MTAAPMPIRLKGIRIERFRQFGDVYLALALRPGCDLKGYASPLLPTGNESIA